MLASLAMRLFKWMYKNQSRIFGLYINILYHYFTKNIYITSPVILYGYVTVVRHLREYDGLRLLDKKVPRILFGPKSEKVTAQLRKLHN
jgi:hypothetical protein